MRVRRWSVVCKWPHGEITRQFFDSEEQAHDDALGAALECAMNHCNGVVFEVVNPTGVCVATVAGGVDEPPVIQ